MCIMMISMMNCRTLLQMHTRTCMCGALCDLLAAPLPLPSQRGLGRQDTVNRGEQRMLLSPVGAPPPPTPAPPDPILPTHPALNHRTVVERFVVRLRPQATPSPPPPLWHFCGCSPHVTAPRCACSRQAWGTGFMLPNAAPQANQQQQEARQSTSKAGGVPRTTISASCVL